MYSVMHICDDLGKCHKKSRCSELISIEVVARTPTVLRCLLARVDNMLT